MPMDTDEVSKTYEHYHIGLGTIKNKDLEKNIFNYFSKASTLSDYEKHCLGNKFQDLKIASFYSGLRHFKKKTIGRLGWSTLTSRKNIVDVVFSLDMVESKNEADDLVISLLNQGEIRYSRYKYLDFQCSGSSDNIELTLKPLPNLYDEF